VTRGSESRPCLSPFKRAALSGLIRVEQRIGGQGGAKWILWENKSNQRGKNIRALGGTIPRRLTVQGKLKRVVEWQGKSKGGRERVEGGEGDHLKKPVEPQGQD